MRPLSAFGEDYHLSPSEGAVTIALVDSHRRVLDVTALEARIAAL
jgi:hypothetical protein